MQNVLTSRRSALWEAPQNRKRNLDNRSILWMVIPTMIRGKTMTHLVFSDTFNLSHVSRSASVILESLMKLGASRCGVCLPWILLWARSSFWRSGAFLKFVSTGSLSWALRTQATVGFTSSGWFWSLLIWFRPPHHWKSQVRGRGADKQNVKHENLEAGGRVKGQEHPFPSQKYGMTRAADTITEWDLMSCACWASALSLSYISSPLCYPFNTGIRQILFFHLW